MMKLLTKLSVLFCISSTLYSQTFIFHEPAIMHDSLRVYVLNNPDHAIYPVPKRNCTIKSNVLGKDSMNCYVTTHVFQPLQVPCNIENSYTFDCNDSLNNTVFEAFIRKGSFDGKYIVHYLNGDVLMEITFYKGEISGSVYLYYQAGPDYTRGKNMQRGCLMAELIFTSDNKLWNVKKLLDRNGKSLKKDNFKNGSGTLNFYRNNGTLLRTVELTNGILNGTCTYYYSNGLVLMSGNYLNGKQAGSWKEFDLNGTLLLETMF